MQSELLSSLPGYHLLRLSFAQGEVFDITIPHGFSLDNSKTYMVHVEGEVECRRTQHALVDVKRPGDTTSSAPGFHAKLGPIAGRMHYKVLTPTYAYLCLMRKDALPIRVRDVWLDEDEAYTVPAGKAALRVLGGDIEAYATGGDVVALAHTLILEVTL